MKKKTKKKGRKEEYYDYLDGLMDVAGQNSARYGNKKVVKRHKRKQDPNYVR